MSERFIVKERSEMVVGEPTLNRSMKDCIGADWCIYKAAARMNRGETRRTHPLVFGENSSFGVVPASELWLVDTHDAWHTARVEAPKDSPRFQVKPASEMREGEPSTSSWIPLGWTAENAFARVQMWCKGLNAGDFSLKHHWDGWQSKRGAYTPLWGIIDTNSPEWQAFDKDFGKALYGVSYSSAPTLDLSGPTDAEIVAAYERERRECHRFDVLMVGEFACAMEDVRAAWSRELKRRQADAREAERHRVICEDQYEP